MSELQLSQLPLEILDIIVSYLPSSELDKLDGIDYLKTTMLKNICSSVVITGTMPRYSMWRGSSFTCSQVDEPKPEFSCFKSLTDFLTENHLPFPKSIEFIHPIDIIKVYDSNPSILQDCIIETDLGIFYYSARYSSELRKSYLQKLISLPLKFRRIVDCHVIYQMMHESSAQFTRNLTSATFPLSFPLEIVFGDDRYHNLVDLEISEQISHEVVKYIPRSVKKLNCCVLCPNYELSEFGFPSGLKNLKVTFHDYPDNCVVNFRILEYLVELEFHIMDYGYKIENYNVSFPKSLKSVKIFALDMVEVNNQCPQLTHFDCSKIKHTEGKDNTFNFPEKLTRLSVDVDILKHIENCQNNPVVKQVGRSKKRKSTKIIDSTSIKFPKNLESLYIIGDQRYRQHKIEFDESQTLFSNIEENRLKNLTSVTLSHVENFMGFGRIPPSLTQLSIHSPYRMESLNRDFFDDLKRITTLKVLRINCSHNSVFDYELPPKLQSFEFINRVLHKVSIKSESLKHLHLESSKLKEVTPGNVQLPGSLIELSLVESVSGFDKPTIISIDESFVFPQKLQKLKLEFDRLQRIPKIPPNLKTLHTYYDSAETKEFDFAELPNTLEELRLINTTESDRHCSFPNLSHLVNLKTLNYSLTESGSIAVKSVNLDTFPKSLTNISMCRCGIRRFTGTFKSFPKLEYLNLRVNYLRDWLSLSPNESPFGTDIIAISFMYNDLDIDTVKNLLHHLEQNPSFKQLEVDDIRVPEDMQYLRIERYLA
ncbi:hypothetical protein G210_1441 [Candida maltosa Xu316]|uniref:F-box domain-containing protein n=1 Tax=Candida maltosa (strain Xu316) TaxID=1245528 RepID=M3J7L2_CANMX|nr:hypothetical protein G210_1441 [Candida maltosa Xu316]